MRTHMCMQNTFEAVMEINCENQDSKQSEIMVKRCQQQWNKPGSPTWVTGQDLHAPGLACGLWDGGAIRIQQYWTRARKTQQAAEHVLCSCPWEQRQRERRGVNLIHKETASYVWKSAGPARSHLYSGKGTLKAPFGQSYAENYLFKL